MAELADAIICWICLVSKFWEFDTLENLDVAEEWDKIAEECPVELILKDILIPVLLCF
jgi:hypothetical protein